MITFLDLDGFQEALWENEKFDHPVVVEGDIDIACHFGWQLPRNLIVVGQMFMSDMEEMETLPAGLAVRDTLGIDACEDFVSVSDDLCCEGRLWIEKCPSFTTIPDGLKTATLRIENCPKFVLPKRMTISEAFLLDDLLIFPNRIVIKSAYQPETLLAAMQGRKVSDILSHPLFAGHPIMDMTITSAEYTPEEDADIGNSPNLEVRLFNHAFLTLNTDGNPLELLEGRL